MPFTAEHARRCRADFPSLARRQDGRPIAFLDGPAGTQVPRAVIDAVRDYSLTCNANTHGAFVTSRETDRLLAATRETLAAFLGAPPGATISFGANMTTLAFALARAFARRFRAGDEVVITALDHEANRGPWLTLESSGVRIVEVGIDPRGRLQAGALERAIGPRTRLVALGMASNALGTVNDAALARALCRRHGAWLLLDAVHYAPHFPLDAAALDAEFLLCSAYKFYGPHVGILCTQPGLLDELPVDRLRTQAERGPERIETGTLNHAAIAGVKAAVEYLATFGGERAPGAGGDLRRRLVDAMTGIASHEHELAAAYHRRVAALPGVTVHGPGFDEGPRAPTVSITLDGAGAGALARRLAAEGLQVWDGDFYAARPVELLGLAERGGLLRVGMSMYNTADEVDRLLAALERIAAA